MKKSIIKFLMKVYLKMRKGWDPLTVPSKIRDEFNIKMNDFSKRINSMPYKSDPLKGLLDNTADPNTFFDNKEHNRDCDDFQRMWSWWGVFNGYKAKEYVICDPTTVRTAFQTMHVIGTLEKDGKFYLTNYRPSGPFDSEKKALEQMAKYHTYKDDRVIVYYREITMNEGIIDIS